MYKELIEHDIKSICGTNVLVFYIESTKIVYEILK